MSKPTNKPCRACGQSFKRGPYQGHAVYCKKPECQEQRKEDRREQNRKWQRKNNGGPAKVEAQRRQREERRMIKGKKHRAKCGHICLESHYFNCPTCKAALGNFNEEFLYVC